MWPIVVFVVLIVVTVLLIRMGQMRKRLDELEDYQNECVTKDRVRDILAKTIADFMARKGR